MFAASSLADFEVIDNKVPQQLDVVSFERAPLRVTLAFDMSVSVTGERLDHLRAAGEAVLDGLRAEDEAQLLTFSHQSCGGSGPRRTWPCFARR